MMLPLRIKQTTKFYTGMVLALTLALGPTAATTARADGGVGTAIAGAALAKELLEGISNKVKGDVTARTDAITESKGPDEDDLKVRAAADNFDGLFGLEWELKADTHSETGGLTLGPNRGSAHTGYARMIVKWDDDGGWVIDRRRAFAFAKKDTTPVRGKSNATAAASVATFSINGKVKSAWTVKDKDDRVVALGSGAGVEQALRLDPRDDVPITGLAAAAYAWSESDFLLEDVVIDGRELTRVTPPVDEVRVGHTFVQLADSTNFLNPFIDSGGRSAILDANTRELTANARRAHGARLLGEGDTVDFTVAGGDISLPTTFVRRGDLTDREVINAYLEGLVVTAPTNAQDGYVPDVALLAALGDDGSFPLQSRLGADGGFGEPGDFQDNNLIGFVVEVAGSLSDAVNTALSASAHPVQDLVDGLGAGDPLDFDVRVTGSETAQWYSATDVTVPGVPKLFQVDPSQSFGVGPGQPVFVEVGTEQTGPIETLHVQVQNGVRRNGPFLQPMQVGIQAVDSGGFDEVNDAPGETAHFDVFVAEQVEQPLQQGGVQLQLAVGDIDGQPLGLAHTEDGFVNLQFEPGSPVVEGEFVIPVPGIGEQIYHFSAESLEQAVVFHDAQAHPSFAGGGGSGDEGPLVPAVLDLFLGFTGEGLLDPNLPLFTTTVSAEFLLTGDFDSDGDVDDDDYEIWQSGLGIASGAVLSDGDANGDGAVDGQDFLDWQAHRGNSLANLLALGGGLGGGSSSAIAVPEPHAALLLLFATPLAAMRRRSC